MFWGYHHLRKRPYNWAERLIPSPAFKPLNFFGAAYKSWAQLFVQMGRLELPRCMGKMGKGEGWLREVILAKVKYDQSAKPHFFIVVVKKSRKPFVRKNFDEANLSCWSMSFFEAIMGPICARVFYFGSQGLFVTASRCGPVQVGKHQVRNL